MSVYMSERPLISLCMIVKNEEANLPRCLDSVKDIVDEIIIVDTGSTDNTIKVAQRYGARVFSVQWHDDFSEARNVSIEKARGKWILFMDADDELDCEDKRKIKDLLIDGVEGYFFKTINYVGKSPGVEAALNMNFRLMRNRPEYRFVYPIHEQIAAVIQKVKPDAKLINADIKVYHYGYLDDEVAIKDKRERNMRIIRKVLEKNPFDAFMRFNMGNEYFALCDYEKALNEYALSLKNTREKTGYLSKLYVRMVLCYSELKRYDEALNIIDVGLKDYPSLTDLVFLGGYIHHVNKRYTIAERLFKRCIEMGEAPLEIGFIMGVGSFRAHHALGELYLELEDYDEAYAHFEQAYKQNNSFTEPLYKMCHILVKTKGISEARNTFERILNLEDFKDLSLLISIFLRQKRYDICLEYINRLINNNMGNDEIYYLCGKCLFNLKRLDEAYSIWKLVNRESIYYNMLIPDLMLMDLIKGRSDDSVVEACKKIWPKHYSVFQRLRDLLGHRHPQLLSDDASDSKKYADIIFDILDKLLYLEEFDIFEAALNLLNLIEDNTVLLRLGKLYYKYGFKRHAEDEILRSMKLFNVYDCEALDLLNRISMG
ncbi:tetratricopeptide repeat-containing glycosyltransferase family 2 protein [Caldanaerobius polysaccharolyticus]|uniref:tetratricopeptide repeat-containing glycosyltransferase family 2 protein n=1 Tax=Caldanaerobius polysaccharolyticus TaxID=44256 RepID=UPI000A4218EF|nr:TPR domain-containing glycosyltransferase [Caldanaerobius polysaccharolyticus]